MVITLENQFEVRKIDDLAKEFIGKRIFVGMSFFFKKNSLYKSIYRIYYKIQTKFAILLGWPFLQEAKVQAISDEHCKYELSSHSHIKKTPYGAENREFWCRKAERLEYEYNKRFGTITGPVEAIVHVLVLKGI